jgi:hypothetical protein
MLNLNRLERFKYPAVCIVIAFFLMLCSYTPATATLLTFDDASVHGGSLTYDGIGGALVGSDIPIDRLLAIDVQQNSGVFDVIGGELNFETGINNLEVNNIWAFDSGGSFVITGTVVDANNHTIANGDLLTGYFTGTPVIISSDDSGSPQFTFSGFGIDTKNSQLLAYFGLDDVTFKYAATNITAAATNGIDENGGFTATVAEADVTNSVPDASIMFLLGPSLLCLGMIGRRKFRSES